MDLILPISIGIPWLLGIVFLVWISTILVRIIWAELKYMRTAKAEDMTKLTSQIKVIKTRHDTDKNTVA